MGMSNVFSLANAEAHFVTVKLHDLEWNMWSEIF